MIFGKIKDGRMVKYQLGKATFEGTKLNNAIYWGDGSFITIDHEQEVELVTRCENCKYFDSDTSFCESFNNYMQEIPIQGGGGLGKDVKTFYCDDFKRKIRFKQGV